MKSMFVRPLPFTVTTSSGWATATPATNLNVDHPGIVAKATSTTASLTVSLGSSTSIDTVALIGSNLLSTSTVSVTAGTYSSGSTAAWTGTKDTDVSAKSIFQFSAVSTASVTISITGPAAFEVQRLVIGKRLEVDGIEQNAEQTFEDQSLVESGPGWTTVEDFGVLPVWKAKMPWVSDVQYRNEFFPFLSKVGLKTPVLFIPVSDDPTRFQHEAVFGRFTSTAKATHTNYDLWTVEFTLRGLAA